MCISPVPQSAFIATLGPGNGGAEVLRAVRAGISGGLASLGMGWDNPMGQSPGGKRGLGDSLGFGLKQKH